QMRNVAVLGSNVAEALFPFEDPMGQTVRLGSYFYVIVGVLRDRTPLGVSGGHAAEDFNSDVYIPLSTCKVRFGETIMIRQAGSFQREQVALSQVTLTVADIDKVRPTGQLIEAILSRHPKNDWSVTVPLDKLEAAEREKSRFTRLMAMIASIS